METAKEPLTPQPVRVSARKMRAAPRLLALLALLLRPCADAVAVFSVAGPAARATLVVGDEAAGGRTYLSELFVRRGARDGGGESLNLLFNFSAENTPGLSLARLSGTALAWSGGGSGSVFCGAAGGVSPPVRALSLSCDTPGATLHILEAFYGTGAAHCDAPAPGACNDARAPAVVGAACEAQSNCTVYQGAPSFPEDPCPDQPKTLFVKAACSSGNGHSSPPLGDWAASTGGAGAAVAGSGGSAVVVTGVSVGPFAREDWILNLSTGFEWAVARTYTAAQTYTCERGPLLTMNTQYALGDFPMGSQIPSVLDADMMWTAEGVAFPCALGDAPDASWSVAASPHLAHDVLLSPSLLRFDSAITCAAGGAAAGAAAPCGLVMTWPTWPGVGGGETTMGLGVHAYAPSGAPGPRTVAAGDTLALSWGLQPPADPPALDSMAAGLLPFNFSHPSRPAVESSARRLAARFNMFAGDIFGNSPASIVCLHEMSWFPLVQGLFGSTAGHAALQKELAMFAAHAVRADGYVYPRWNFQEYVEMPIHDQLGHFIMSFYYHALNTGDRDFAASAWPAVLHAISYINSTMLFASTDLANTPPPCSGLPNSQCADNWFDIVCVLT